MNFKEEFKKETGYDAFAYDKDYLSIGSCENYVEWLEKKISKIDSKTDFEKAVEPAIRYLFKNHNPHTSIYINYDTAELLLGEMCYSLSNEIPD